MSTSSVGHGGRFEPPVGAVVAGKYRIERKLGEGGMGLVVAASHLALGGEVALKFLSPGPDEELRPDAVARFTREAQNVARLKSKHVTRVLDMGTVDTGAPFIVMELLEGMDLHKYSRKNGPLSIVDAVEFVLQAAEGVAEAHALGIVHRDLKPANLFLTHGPDGTPFVRVLDFGIAKNIHAKKEAGDVSLTAGTDVLGSPLYMSPEQIRNPKDVDPRSDVWSLGAILYKLLTGRAAFDADNPSASLAMIVMEEPTPITRFRPDVPPQLEAVIRRSMEKKREVRFQNVDELACALLPFAPMRPRERPWVPVNVTGSNLPAMAVTTGTALPAPLTVTGPSLPMVVYPGQTTQSSPRSSSTLAIIAGVCTVLSIVLIAIMLVMTSSSAKNATAQPTMSASSIQEPARVPVAEPSASTNVVAVVPSAAPSAPSPPPPAASASVAPTKATKRPARNDALDDRL